MAWIESHSNLARHPKTRRLMKLLGWSLPDTIGNLHLLWWWVQDFAPTGDLSHFSAEDLTADLDLCGATPEQFLEAMVAAGFLDRIEGTLCIHDWVDYTSKSLRSLAARTSRPGGPGYDPSLAGREPEQPASSCAEREPKLVEYESQGAARIDCVEDTARQGAGSGRDRSQLALRAGRRDPTSANAESEPNTCNPNLEFSAFVPPNNEADHTAPSSNPAPAYTQPEHEFDSANTEHNSSLGVPAAWESQIPHLLDEQPGFTNIWWPKFLDIHEANGTPLTLDARRDLLASLARNPFTAVELLRALINEAANAITASAPEETLTRHTSSRRDNVGVASPVPNTS